MATKKSEEGKIKVSFYKKAVCWYAEVPEHTEAQNLMVSGADELCDVMACGKKRVSVELVGSDKPKKLKDSIIDLKKVEQGRWGAWYDITGASGTAKTVRSLPDKIWLCNVTKTVCGGVHPDYIYITGIEPNDGKPYDGNPPKKA